MFDARFAGALSVSGSPVSSTARSTSAATTQLGCSRCPCYHELVARRLRRGGPVARAAGLAERGRREWFEHHAHGGRRLTGGEWAALQRALETRTWLPVAELEPPTFSHLHPKAVPLAYLESRALVDFLARRVGDAGLARILEAWMRLRDLDRALLRVTRLDTTGIQAGLVAELQ